MPGERSRLYSPRALRLGMALMLNRRGHTATSGYAAERHLINPSIRLNDQLIQGEHMKFKSFVIGVAAAAICVTTAYAADGKEIALEKMLRGLYPATQITRSEE